MMLPFCDLRPFDDVFITSKTEELLSKLSDPVDLNTTEYPKSDQLDQSTRPYCHRVGHKPYPQVKGAPGRQVE